MRSSLGLPLPLLLTSLGAYAEERSPVIVELFTSEGCSSCPPADAVLEHLERSQPVRGAQIIPLGFHVDYWNRLGWADPYSSSDFSRRQEAYSEAFGGDRIYTPQMVVDGSREFVGEESLAIKSVVTASKQPKTVIEMTLSPRCELSPSLKLTVSPTSKPLTGDAAQLFVAVTESDLVNKVTRGENAGRTLRHSAVVRQLRSLGEVNKGPKPAPTLTQLSLDKEWKRGAIQVVAFLQEKRSRRILGATALPLCEAGR